MIEDNTNGEFEWYWAWRARNKQKICCIFLETPTTAALRNGFNWRYKSLNARYFVAFLHRCTYGQIHRERKSRMHCWLNGMKAGLINARRSHLMLENTPCNAECNDCDEHRVTKHNKKKKKKQRMNALSSQCVDRAWARRTNWEGQQIGQQQTEIYIYKRTSTKETWKIFFL